MVNGTHPLRRSSLNDDLGLWKCVLFFQYKFVDPLFRGRYGHMGYGILRWALFKIDFQQWAHARSK